MKGLIYQVINIQNNKCYIGKTRYSLKKRKNEHCLCTFGERRSQQYFHKALRKYGLDNFKWFELGYCYSEQSLNEAEVTYIEFFQSNISKYGYNMTKGGEGLCNPSDDVRKRISDFRKSYTGWNHTEETKKKMSESQLGIKNHRYNKKRTKEEIQKQIATTKKNGSHVGEKNGMYGKGYLIKGKNAGKKLSTEAKNKISESSKKLWEDENYRNSIISANKKHFEDSAYKEKCMSGLREYWNNPENKRKYIQTNLEGGNNPRALKVMVEGTIYSCIKEASDALGYRGSALYSRFNSYKKKGKFPDGWGFL